ncbi:MAG: FecR domain-containing protein [Myxococcota bacterium]
MSQDTQIAQMLVAYVRDELNPVERQWMASQLERAPRLRARADALSRALATAHEAPVALAAEHRERLVARVQLAAAPRFSRMALGMVSTTAVIGLLVAVVFAFEIGRQRATNQEAGTMDFSGAVTEGLEWSTDARREISPHLRALVSKDWKGRVDGDTRDTHVQVEQGRIVFGFAGGGGRRLEVTTPQARVVVIGTRFSVAVDQTRSESRVEVSQGRVAVWRGSRVFEVGAGERAVLRGARVTVEPAEISADLDDPYLVEVTPAKTSADERGVLGMMADDSEDTRNTAQDGSSPAEGSSSVQARGVRGEGASASSANVEKTGSTQSAPQPIEKAQRATSADATENEVRPASLEHELRQLERGDVALRDGEHERAIALYDALIGAARVSMVKDMARLGRARALGRSGRYERATRQLDALAASGGEIARQARLFRCELDRDVDVCRMERCYDALRGVEDRQLANEASRLYERSRTDELRCEAVR